jgi:hypothetical protein
MIPSLPAQGSVNDSQASASQDDYRLKDQDLGLVPAAANEYQ